MARDQHVLGTWEYPYQSGLQENPPLTDSDTGFATTWFVSNAITKSTVVEIDFGSTLAHEKVFTITDTNIVNTDFINTRIEDVASTDKSKDDVEMETFLILSSANNGSANILIRSLQGRVKGKFKIRYFVNKN